MKWGQENGLHGVLLLDKEGGWTSHDLVAKIRSITKQKRVGHAGTLDPLATGLMVILLGNATRLSNYLSAEEKAYEVTLKLGTETSTHDSEGETVFEGELLDEHLDLNFASQVLKGFIGVQDQIPPAFSALKVDGVTAHRAARKGKEITLKAREIEVFEISNLAVNKELKTWSFFVRVSKGTYIRSLVRDIGRELGCGAYMTALRRTSSGSFNIEDALKLQDIETMVAASPASVSVGFQDLSKVFNSRFTARDEETLSGRALSPARVDASLLRDNPTQKIAAFSLDDRLLGLYELGYKNEILGLRPKTVFPDGIYNANLNEQVAAIGVFDGVHKGHQELIERLVRLGKELSLPTTVITFDPLPGRITKDDRSAYSLIPLSERIRLIKELGVDNVVIIPFTPKLAKLSPSEFLFSVLYKRLIPRALLVGENFRFGYKAEGNPETLKTLLTKQNTQLQIIPLKHEGGITLSSTLIRELISKGEFKKAEDLLGRDIFCEGLVVEGLGKGRELGFKTANIDMKRGIYLPIGIYFAKALIKGQTKDAAFFVGAPHFASHKLSYEAHILDFDEDIYGEILHLHSFEKLGEPRAHDSIESLILSISGYIDLIKGKK